LSQVVVDEVAASYRAAGRIDAKHHGDDVRVFFNRVDLSFDEAIAFEDRAVDLDDGDLLGGVARERVEPFLR
jgi:hypothetical protein